MSELSVVPQASDLSTWEAETMVQDLPLFHSELEASLGYLGPCIR